MIQALQTQMLDPKALKAEGKIASGKAEAVDLEGALLDMDFANELEASLATGTEVKPVEVSAEQALEMPSALVNPVSNGSVETTSPKVFDPALTKGVEKLIQPTTTEVQAQEVSPEEVLKLANGEVKADAKAELKGEFSQAMLKTPQVSQGRAPAIDFAQSEIDPQLLNNQDFVAQKNIVTKKPVSNPYGMKALPQQQKIALETDLQSTQVVSEAGAASSEAQAPVNSQQFILSMMNEQKIPTAHETQAPARVFDMNQIRTSQPDQIMNQISDYIVQAKTAKEPTVNMRVNHDELGMIDITVSKSGMNHESVAINIGAHSSEGKNFFQQNSKDLLSHLTTAGLNVSDLKVETPTQTAKNDFDFGSQSGRNQNGSERQFGSEQNQRRHESDRRQELWKLLNKEAA
jgi:predicted DNA binding CopG/RHH family protein